MIENAYRKFKYKTICYKRGAQMYSDSILEIGEKYNVYLCHYQFTTEYEVFKDNIYHTSFIINSGMLDTLHEYFYTEEQMRDINLNKVLDEGGI